MYNNYYVDGYDYEDKNSGNNFNLKNRNLNKKLILGGIFGLVIIIIIVIVNISSYYNSYSYFESKLINSAKDYIKNNNIIIADEIYLDVLKLNIDMKDGCNEISGVFVDSDYNYTANLICEDYRSDVVDNDTTKVSLKGEEIVLLAKGINYTEMGINDNNMDVNIQGVVGTEEGVYNLNYIITSNNMLLASLTRKVVIVDNIYVKSLFPTIQLIGEKVEHLEMGESYNEQGVFASDQLDLDITNKVKTIGSVNSKVEGEYEISYSVTNSRGYTNNVTRKVIVISSFSTTNVTAYLSTTNLTNQDVTINIQIVGDDYSYMILPDGKKTSETTVEYKVSENGIYNFISYDDDGKTVTKTIEVNNIDKIKPNASCKAFVYFGYTKIHITPNSGKKISSYNYVVDGVSSGDITSASHQVNTSDIKNVSVIIKDSIGNSNEIDCTINTDNYVRKVYINERGKPCLEGFVCYNQGSYSSPDIQFCSTETCGPISKRGCSVTAMATAISVFQKKSSNGNLYDPYTITTEVYNKVCSSSCSGASTARKVANKLGLSASKTYSSIKGHHSIILNALKKGSVVIFRAGAGGVYPQQSGHIMAIIGVNENNEVFLSDPGRSSTYSAQSSKHRVNSWVSLAEIESGEGASAWFVVIG